MSTECLIKRDQITTSEIIRISSVKSMPGCNVLMLRRAANLSLQAALNLAVITTSECHGASYKPHKRRKHADPLNLQALSRTGKVSSHLKDGMNMTDTNKRSLVT